MKKNVKRIVLQRGTITTDSNSAFRLFDDKTDKWGMQDNAWRRWENATLVVEAPVVKKKKARRR